MAELERARQQTRMWNSIPVSHVDARNTNTWVILWCLPAHSARELDGKRSSQDLNWYTEMPASQEVEQGAGSPPSQPLTWIIFTASRQLWVIFFKATVTCKIDNVGNIFNCLVFFLLWSTMNNAGSHSRCHKPSDTPVLCSESLLLSELGNQVRTSGTSTLFVQNTRGRVLRHNSLPLITFYIETRFLLITVKNIKSMWFELFWIFIANVFNLTNW